MKKIFKFVVSSAVVELIVLLIAKLPDIALKSYNYCVEVDKGYMWVINCAIAVVVAVIIQNSLKGKIGLVISVLTFGVTLLISEFALWHRNEFQTVIMNELSNDTVEGMIIGLVAGAVVLALMSRGESK